MKCLPIIIIFSFSVAKVNALKIEVDNQVITLKSDAETIIKSVSKPKDNK